jgi:TonB family protein
MALLVVAIQSPATEQVLVAGQDVPPPRQLHSPTPAYPELARQAEIQGLVILGVTVDECGRPVDLRVLRGIPILNETALTAVKGWRYDTHLRSLMGFLVA